MKGMIQGFIVEKAFEFATNYLADEENIEKWRASVKDAVYELVEDSDNPWDDNAADAVFKFLGW
jgi:hypothetical protein